MGESLVESQNRQYEKDPQRLNEWRKKVEVNTPPSNEQTTWFERGANDTENINGKEATWIPGVGENLEDIQIYKAGLEQRNN